MHEQPSPMRAAIDIGSNTIHIVVARTTPFDLDIVVDREELVRIGESVTATRDISQEKANAAIAVLKRYKTQARRRKAEPILVVATEAIRQANNSADFVEQVKSKTKLEVQLISGNAEAALTFFGTTYEVNKEPGHPEQVGVMDLGGGSLELVTAKNMRINWRTSIPIGSGWLHDRYLTSNPPTYDEIAVADAFLRTYFQGMPLKHRPPVLIATGGSANALLYLVHQAFHMEEHHTRLTQHDLIRCQGLLSSLTAEEIADRYNIPVVRARILLAGALIIQTVMARLHVKEIQISSHGIREGVLLAYERYGEHWLEIVSGTASLNHAQQTEVFVPVDPEEEPFALSGRRKLKERTHKMLELPQEVLKHEDVEAVHKMRVASRRLRATLDAYQSICDPKIFKSVYRQVKGAADALGAARDTDVMLLNLHEQLELVRSEEKDGVQWIIQRLDTFRQQKQQELESFLQQFDEETLTKQVELLIPEGDKSDGKSKAHHRA
jgi:exopolyphosphatase / guanosine-5'-triphosphate,3'-diphosphate pyrophosphatase